jgi:hypothetical protein
LKGTVKIFFDWQSVIFEHHLIFVISYFLNVILGKIHQLQMTEDLVGKIDPEWNRPFKTTRTQKHTFSWLSSMITFQSLVWQWNQLW